MEAIAALCGGPKFEIMTITIWYSLYSQLIYISREFFFLFFIVYFARIWGILDLLHSSLLVISELFLSSFSFNILVKLSNLGLLHYMSQLNLFEIYMYGTYSQTNKMSSQELRLKVWQRWAMNVLNLVNIWKWGSCRMPWSSFG